MTPGRLQRCSCAWQLLLAQAQPILAPALKRHGAKAGASGCCDTDVLLTSLSMCGFDQSNSDPEVIMVMLCCSASQGGSHLVAGPAATVPGDTKR